MSALPPRAAAHRKRVEHVLVDALARFADRRQVQARVPVRKLVKEYPERFDLRRREREAEPAQTHRQPCRNRLFMSGDLDDGTALDLALHVTLDADEARRSQSYA